MLREHEYFARYYNQLAHFYYSAGKLEQAVKCMLISLYFQRKGRK